MSGQPARFQNQHLYLVDEVRLLELDDAFEEYILWLSAQNSSADTIRERTTVVRAFGKFHGIDPRSATTSQVLAYIGRQDLAPWSRTTYYGHLKSFFNWAVGSGQRATHPMAGMRSPKVPARAPRPLSAEEVGRLFMVATERERTWLLLGLYAGFRAHEIAKIRGADVTSSLLYVLGKGGKAVYLPTHPLIWQEAQRYPQTWWFPRPNGSGHLNAETVSHTSTQLFHRAGLTGSIHRCRHTYATELLRSGLNVRVVQTLMRHANLETIAAYTAVDECELSQAILRLGPAA